MKTRRLFIGTALATGAAGILPAWATKPKTIHTRICHHVFFWLKNPESKEDREKLIAGVKSLSKIPVVRDLVVGIPAKTEKRDVVDNSWAVSELMFFDSVDDEAIYQAHPIHKKFAEECSPLIGKVVVYDVQPV